jgi:hypothetical protein
MMNFSGSSRIIIKGDIKVNKRFTDNSVVFIDDFLRCNLLLAFIEMATPCSSLPHTNKTSLPCNLCNRINIRRYVNTCQMANVNGSVSIRQSRRNRISFGFIMIQFYCLQKYEIICLPEHSRMIFPLFVAIFLLLKKSDFHCYRGWDLRFTEYLC